jgi:hypothetical protein
VRRKGGRVRQWTAGGGSRSSPRPRFATEWVPSLWMATLKSTLVRCEARLRSGRCVKPGITTRATQVHASVSSDNEKCQFQHCPRNSESLLLSSSGQPASLMKGFVTSFFNPKGLLVHFAILPNFMSPPASRILSLTFGTRLPACSMPGVSSAACRARTGRVRAPSSITSSPSSRSSSLRAANFWLAGC